MKITSAQFITSVFSLDRLPEPRLIEVAFSGRSNVGKSSLINTLLNRKNLAKTSSTPGRTQAINFFEVNRALYFVDLPGYGYAKVPLGVKRSWQALINGYLEQRQVLRLVIVIIDARREPREDERQFVRWLDERCLPLAVVLTKIDKLKRGERAASIAGWKRYLGRDAVYPFSAVTGEGKQAIAQLIACLPQAGGA
jgi:GTP-binding protein